MATKKTLLNLGKSSIMKTSQAERHKQAAIRCLLIAFSIISVNLILPLGSSIETFNIPREGTTAKRSIIAPFDFEIQKSETELQKNQKEAASRVLPVVEYDYDITDKVIKNLQKLAAAVDDLKSSRVPLKKKSEIKKRLKKFISLSTINRLVRSDIKLDEVIYYIDETMERGILSTLFFKNKKEYLAYKEKYKTDPKYEIFPVDYLNLVSGKKEKTIPMEDIPSKEIVMEEQKKRLKEKYKSAAEIAAVYEIFDASLVPNVFYNSQATKKARLGAVKDVKRHKGKVYKDIIIVEKGSIITSEIYEKLVSLRNAEKSLHQSRGKLLLMLPFLGRILIFSTITALFLIFLKRKKPGLYNNNTHLAALCAILVLQLLLAQAGIKLTNIFSETVEWSEGVSLELMIPALTGTILATILFKTETGFIFTVINGLLYGVVLGYDFKFFIVYMFAGTVTVASVRNVRYRSHFIRSLLFACAAYVFALSVMHLFQERPEQYRILLRNIGLALINSSLSFMTASILVWVFEKTFRITTDLSLIELSDLNNPVLKLLSSKAPGTFHHSILIGNLAEAAATKIRANPLLARVGSYYHDIGKTTHSEYFIENQGKTNVHNSISPNLSAMLIAKHVTEGLKLAREHKLPKIIQDIIQQHHGTSMISFFYKKAVENNPKKQLSPENFQYPGPTPQSKECLIIMLADSVEAGSRSMADVMRESGLRRLIHSIIEQKVQERQLDGCPITFRELADIENSFFEVLKGIYHTRIEYPISENV